MKIRKSNIVRICGEAFPEEQTQFYLLNADSKDEHWLRHPVAEEINIDRLTHDPELLIVEDRFFLRWQEVHPEEIPIHEFVGLDRDEWSSYLMSQEDRSAVIRAYELRHGKLADVRKEKEITRQEGWELLALNWVPLTFFAEAGISRFIPNT